MGTLNLRSLGGRLFLILLIFLGLSCSKDIIEEEVLESIDLTATASSEIIKDQYIVLLSRKPAKKDPRAAAALEALSREIGQMPGARIKGTYKNTLSGFVAKMNPGQAKKLEQDPRVISVTADKYLEMNVTNTTGLYSVQDYSTWGLDRIDQREPLLDRAYVYPVSGGNEIDVYVMDSGIRFTHEEFEGRGTLGKDFVRDFPDEEYDVDDPDLGDGEDCNGHGTHVAGTIGGKNFGVAKNVNLISVRVFSCRGLTSESRVIMAVDWITENASVPAVVNMSIGKVGVEETLELAIENSIQKGIHYVLAAGNEQMNACDYTPARTPGAITVGASDIKNGMAYFSNYGDCLDIYAPGVSITSAGIADDSATRIYDGTSMAAPHVTGIVALYLEKYPDATPAQVHSAIIENSTPDFIKGVPSGPNNLAYSLWDPVEFTPPVHPDLNLRVYGNKQKGNTEIHLVWNPTGDPEVNIYRNGSLFYRRPNTGEFSFNVNGKSNDSYRICELNYSNCSEEVYPDFDGGTDFEPNQPPTANFTYEVNGLEVTFTNTSFDEDGTIISSYLHFGDDYYVNTGDYVYTYSEPGTYTATLYVTDNHEQSSNISKEITVGTVDPSPEDFVLSANAYKVKGQWQTDLSWSPPGTFELVDLYRDGSLIQSIQNTGSYTDRTNFKGGGTLTYKICPPGSINSCSNEVVVQF